MRLVRNISFALLLVLICTPASTLAVEGISTYLFADVIQSKGTGAIDLFKPKKSDRVISGAVLEAFRQDNLGFLVFAVDVNEASSGAESADSQGVAIKSAVLTITIAGEVVQYNQYTTLTRSFLAQAGDTVRKEYYTMVGTTGTSRISANSDSELIGSSLDQTLSFAIDRDLSQATSATLEIALLETNLSLGDPEVFYDFSNGFEEMALLTREDARYLEQLAPGRELAPLVIDESGDAGYSWSYFPSSQSYYVVAYEDLYPAKGDYDFNDLVVAYQVSIGQDVNGDAAVIRGNGYLVARGAMYDHDWHLKIELPEWATGEASYSVFAAGSHSPMDGFPLTVPVMGTADLNLLEHVAAIYSDGESTYVNTFVEQSLVQGPKFEFSLTLDTPIAMSLIDQAPYDPYIYVHDTGYEVHLIDKLPALYYSYNTLEGLSGFRDDAGFPFAIVSPDNWQPPLAGIDMGLAYPTFMDFVKSQGAKSGQWYRQPSAGRVKPVTPAVWKW
jgi:LruC domain-containing protein